MRLLLLLLAGCATVPAAFKPYNEGRLLMAWLDDGLPRGDCGSVDIRIKAYPDVASLKRDCNGYDGGCTTRDVVGFLGTGDVILIRYTTGNPKRDPTRLLAHELTHAMRRCAYNNEGDGFHLDLRLWGHYDAATKSWTEGFEDHAYKVITQ